MLAAQNHFNAIRELTKLLTRHRDLTWEMTKREVTERYAGQHFGSYWALAHPLVLTAVYIFLFGVVFKARTGTDTPGYIVYLLSGLIPWLSTQESMSKGAMAVVSNSNIVKQVVFPVEVLPIKGVLASIFSQIIMTALLALYLLVVHHSLPWTFSLLPLLWVTQLAGMCGLAYVLSATGVFVRDIKDIVQISTTVGTYLIPVTYAPEWVPESLRPLLYANPFSYMVWAYQDACFYGRFEHPLSWVVFPVGSMLSLYLGYRIFRRLKMLFGNVL